MSNRRAKALAELLFFLDRGSRAKSDGGARRDRTDDLMLAKHALYQLSYGPNIGSRLRRAEVAVRRLCQARVPR